MSITFKKFLVPICTTFVLSACGEGDVYSGSSFTPASGVVDTEFHSWLGAGPSAPVDDILILSDGGILLAGRFPDVSGSGIGFLFKLQSDGTPDTDFNSRMGSGPDDAVYTMLELDDGDIMIGGDFTKFNTRDFNRIAKINSDGSLDTGFNAGTTGFDGAVSTMAQLDDDIIVGGEFEKYRSSNVGKIVKLSKLGTLNPTFDATVGAGFNLPVNKIRVLSNNSILVGGSFTNFKGSNARRLALLNASGALDVNFASNFGGNGFNSGVVDILEYSSGNILLGGLFTTHNSVSRGALIGMQANGTLWDEANNEIATGFTNAVYSLIKQPDDHLLVGGDFSSYEGNDAPGLTRLDSNFAMDVNFTRNLGSGFNGTVKVVRVQPDGKILVGGDFLRFNDQSLSYLIRLK